MVELLRVLEPLTIRMMSGIGLPRPMQIRLVRGFKSKGPAPIFDPAYFLIRLIHGKPSVAKSAEPPTTNLEPCEPCSPRLIINERASRIVESGRVLSKFSRAKTISPVFPSPPRYSQPLLAVTKGICLLSHVIRRSHGFFVTYRV